MKPINRILLITLCLGICCASLIAQVKTSSTNSIDQRVVKALKENNTTYTTQENGTFEVNFKFDSNRIQKGFIASGTDEIHGIEMRTVFSYAAFSKTDYPANVMKLLLEQNLIGPGAWTILKTKGDFVIANIVRIPADADAKTVDSALQEVVAVADEMEARLTKKDVL